MISQREVGIDTTSFKRALRRVLRQDPDVILIGEMRDEETVQTAMSAAETGHLVLSTIHTVDAAESINRMLDFFPPHQHQQVRSMLAGTLRGVISQRLVPGRRRRPRRGLRDPAHDRPRPRHDPRPRPDRRASARSSPKAPTTACRPSTRRSTTHVTAGRVSVEDAMACATSPHDFKLLLDAQGRRGTTMADVPGRPSAAREAAGAPARSAQLSCPSSAPDPRARRLTAPRCGRWRGYARATVSSVTSVGKVTGDMAVRRHCPVCHTAELVGGKWTLLLVRDLAAGRTRFCELERSLAGISPRTLSLRLRALEEDGIVERHTYPEVPPRVEYSLTAEGPRPAADHRGACAQYGRRWLCEEVSQRRGAALVASVAAVAA